MDEAKLGARMKQKTSIFPYLLSSPNNHLLECYRYTPLAGLGGPGPPGALVLRLCPWLLPPHKKKKKKRYSRRATNSLANLQL